MTNPFEDIDKSSIETKTFGADFKMFVATKKEWLKILHCNIRSVKKNIDEMTVYLDSLDVKIDVIVLTEAWIDEKHSYKIELDGYETFYQYAKINKSDGIVAFIKKSLSPQIKNNMSLTAATNINLSCEWQGVKIAITGIYRPPSCDPCLFNESLAEYLTQQAIADPIHYCNHILVGDMNIDTSIIFGQPNEVVPQYVNDYLDILAGQGYISAINGITRFKDANKGSCLDHIFIKKRALGDCIGAIVLANITDHNITSIFIEGNRRNNCSDHLRQQNQENNGTTIDWKGVENTLKHFNWGVVTSIQDTNHAIESFVIHFKNIIKNNSIIPSNRRKKYKKLKPWITNNLIQLIQLRDTMKKKLRNDPSNETLKSQFRQTRTRLTNQIKKTKLQYQKNEIQKAGGDLKKIWEAVNDFTNTKRSSKQIKAIKKINGETNTKPLEIANTLNQYYATAAQNIASHIPNAQQLNQDEFPEYNTTNSIFVAEATDQEVLKYIKTLKASATIAPDGISANFLRKTAEHIIKPMTHIVNCCIKNGDFPTICKEAHITPVFKGGETDNPQNWRPICLVSNISKVIEKVLKQRIMSFLNGNNFFSQNQYGYRPGMSTQDAIIALANPIYNCLNNQQPCIVFYVDLQKAFDTCSPVILKRKLWKAGIRGKMYSILCSFIDGRKHRVKIRSENNQEILLSDIEEADCGLAQGTVLAAVLFIIYINDLSRTLLECQIISYCDDTAICIKDNTWENLKNKSEAIIIKIKNWLDAHKLSMNISKTNFTAYTANLQTQPDIQLDLHLCQTQCNSDCNNKMNIQRKSSVKYLGVQLDCCLKWREHCNYTATRLRKTMYKFHELKLILPRNMLRQIYFGLVQSIAQYAIAAWGGTFRSNTKPIKTAMNAILKIALSKPRRYSTEAIYKELDVPNLTQLYIINIILVARTMAGQRVAEVHDRQTRQRANDNFYIQRPNRQIYQLSPMHMAAKIYNKLPIEIKNLRDQEKNFKKQVKKYILGLDVAQLETILT